MENINETKVVTVNDCLLTLVPVHPRCHAIRAIMSSITVVNCWPQTVYCDHFVCITCILWSFVHTKPVDLGFVTMISVVSWQLIVIKQINQVDQEGWCPLVHAAANGHVEAVSFLLQCDWSQLRDKQPTRTEALQQALSVAARNGHLAVCNCWC